MADSEEVLKKILIVDDDSDCLNVMEIALRNDYHVTTEEDSEHALQLCHSNSFDLIILDILMPGINGFDFYKALKKHKNPAKVIMMSGGMGSMAKADELLLKAFEIKGIDDTILKPFDIEVLEEKIKYCLG